MELNIGARVTCGDEPVGYLSRVILDRDSGEVRELVLDLSPILMFNVVAPVDLVEHADERVLRLHCTRDTLQDLPLYAETEFIPPGVAERTAPPFDRAGALLRRPAVPIKGVEKRHHEPGEIEITEGMPVECVDGRCGEVDEVVTDQLSRKVTALVIRKGRFFTRDVVVPTTYVDEVTPARVRLSLARAELDRFAA